VELPRTLLRLDHDGAALGEPLSGGPGQRTHAHPRGHAGPSQLSAAQPSEAVAAPGATHRGVAGRPTLGPGPDRLPPGPEPVHGAQGAPALPLPAADPATGTRTKISRADKRSYEHAAPGDLVHIDVKKLGRIPDGGGWRYLGQQVGKRNKQRKPAGYAFLHHAVDDHSRLVYSEIHADEKQETAVGFWRRARAWFARRGIVIRAVLTDNGNAYRSKLWAKAMSATKHRRTRPCRPQTNGKVERFNRTLLEEWAYAREYRSEA
jgi:transposase InsO family protein